MSFPPFAAVIAAKEGDVCTATSGTIDWTSTNPVVKRCDPSPTGANELTCVLCTGQSNSKCTTEVQDPSGLSSLSS